MCSAVILSEAKDLPQRNSADGDPSPSAQDDNKE